MSGRVCFPGRKIEDFYSEVEVVPELPLPKDRRRPRPSHKMSGKVYLNDERSEAERGYPSWDDKHRFMLCYVKPGPEILDLWHRECGRRDTYFHLRINCAVDGGRILVMENDDYLGSWMIAHEPVTF